VLLSDVRAKVVLSAAGLGAARAGARERLLPGVDAQVQLQPELAVELFVAVPALVAEAAAAPSLAVVPQVIVLAKKEGKLNWKIRSAALEVSSYPKRLSTVSTYVGPEMYSYVPLLR
jgi:hypothetical protein